MSKILVYTDRIVNENGTLSALIAFVDIQESPLYYEEDKYPLHRSMT